ncbi:ATP-binding cassette, subfamily F, member 3 [Pseudobutyrivibrio sp. NOR37]|uniref:ABC-F family ATP-binding cassette domain-containing protein n=2 Tax=Pseudobutyrivibrio TaxID=46205 RepID=A0A6M0LFE9_PSEXY|nr:MULTISPECIES: ABC-F family ATP-binding cassette domain-containing protein [Pseudobutyrivibrio]NEX01186.1 ABC-F family ATP-binding cassette domain-containing protein [Pseudobutyrivibrio xylanivorans]SFR65629.1 ATP-binding cassette, subfamily F, member 3 [Pseudobutyrivibrio sp. NOR37]
MLLNVSHIYKSYGEDNIIKDATFTVDEGSKVAIVGNNGTGKSTLLKIIIGEIMADDGEVTLKKDATMGYLAQYQEDAFSSNILNTVLSAREDLLSMEKRLSEMESMMSSIDNSEMAKFMDDYHKLQHQFDLQGGYTFRSEAIGILKGLGFEQDDFDKSMNELSGGQKTRVSLGRLLASSPDLLLLDEPINHLDLKSIMWLEGYLSSYKGAVIIVAHDRYFLDKIADHVVDLSYGRTSVYTGNYTAFMQQKEIYMISYERSYEKQQKEIEHQKAVIDKLQSFNREKSIKRAESRKKLLDKMDVMDAPDKDMPKMRLTLEIEKESGKDVLDFSHVTKFYEDKNIFTDLSFEVHKGDRIAILGDNGTGKTTILKCINGLTDFESGEIRFGANVTVGYYDQEQQGLTETNTIFSELHDAYPFLTETKVRNTLAAFMFTEDDVFKRISDLSGGERGRVSLAKLMLSKSNLLILDEPTNHLDMDSKQMLEEALNEYDGTLLYVSHDRYFVNRTANMILELSDGKLIKYLGNYDDYIAKKEQLYGTQTESVSLGASEETAAKLDYKEQKRIEAEKRKLQNKISKIEEEIETLESKKAAIEEEFLKPENMTNSAKLNELTAKQKEIDSRLEELYDEWGLLNP